MHKKLEINVVPQKLGHIFVDLRSHLVQVPC